MIEYLNRFDDALDEDDLLQLVGHKSDMFDDDVNLRVNFLLWQTDVFCQEISGNKTI